MIKPERGLTHNVEHHIGGVFRSNFQPARHMGGDKFLVILTVGAVDSLITCMMHGEVVTHTAPYE